MFDLLQPWWLIALGVIPLIRWLHRRQAALSTQTVSAIFLWQVDAAEDSPGRVQRPPDPAWRRRALIAALLIAALATPTIEREHTTLTVWLDDSLSMLTVENGETRTAAGRRQLAEELQGNDFNEIVTHSLSQSLPPQLEESSAHWLVTDGASEKIREWADKAHVDRTIHVGTETENVAVTRLAARRAADDDNAFDLLMSISNTGTEQAERQLGKTTITLEPGETIHKLTRIQATDESIEISIDARDALSNDDRLILPAGALSLIRSTVEVHCGQALRTAIEQHPALVIVDDDSVTDLEVTCPRETFPDIEPSVRPVGRVRALGVGGPSRPDIGARGPSHVGAASRRDDRGQRPLPQFRRDTTPVWLPHELSSGRLHLPPEFIASTEWPGHIDTTRQRVLLQSDGLPLITVTQNADDTTATVDTVIDMRHAEFTRQPEYAALLAILVDVASGRQLLDGVMAESRPIAESVIRPKSGPEAPPTEQHLWERRLWERRLWERRPAAKQVPLSWLFVLTAMLVLAFDTTLLAGARKRAAHA